MLKSTTPCRSPVSYRNGLTSEGSLAAPTAAASAAAPADTEHIGKSNRKDFTMRIGLKVITLLAAGAAAVAIAAAPAAAADTQQGPADQRSCVSSASATICQKPGDAEINSSIPAPYPGVFGVYGPFWAG
jgi:hypothetical protein